MSEYMGGGAGGFDAGGSGGWGSLFGGGVSADTAQLNGQQQELLRSQQPAGPGQYGPQLDPATQTGVGPWMERNNPHWGETNADGSISGAKTMQGALSGGQQLLAQGKPTAGAPPAPAVTPGVVPHNDGGAYTPAAQVQATPGNPYLMQQLQLAQRRGGGLL